MVRREYQIVLNREDNKMEEKNAIITNVSLEIEDHGILSSFLTLDYGGSGQGFGGYFLYSPSGWKEHDKGWAGHFIWRVLETVGVSDWSQLKGKVIRVRIENDFARAIAHPIKNNWFYPTEEFEAFDSNAE